MNSYIVGIVPEDKVIAANKDADKLDSGKTGKTFTVPLWPLTANTKTNPSSHRWFCWWMSAIKQKEIRKDFDPKDPANPTNKHQSKIYDLSKGWTAESILTDNGLKTISIDLPNKVKKG